MTADPTALAAGLSEAQKQYLLSCPEQMHICAEVRPMRNWGSVPAALVRRDLMTAKCDRPWDTNTSVYYNLTELGLAVRQSLTDRDGEG